MTDSSRGDAPALGQLLPEPPWGEPPVHPCGARLASWLHRVVGRLIDVLVVAIPALVVGALTGSRGASDLVGVALVVALAVCNGALGQSPGKRLVGLRLVRDRDGQLIGGSMGVVRELAHLVDTFTLLLGWFFPVWDGKRQTLADKIMSTVCVPLR